MNPPPSSPAATAVAAFERPVTSLLFLPEPSVVHVWAPWCPDCQAEFGPHGWGAFVSAHPAVRFLFVVVWSAEDGDEILQANHLRSARNLTILHHPIRARAKGERASHFLGRPLRWIPTTWVFRAGQLQASFDQSTVEFPVLARLLTEAPRP